MLTILLLRSISEEYEGFRIAIESHNKLPTSEILKERLLEEYESRKNRKLDVEDARYANRNFKKGHKKGSNGQNQTQNTFKFACHSCGKTGHKAK